MPQPPSGDPGQGRDDDPLDDPVEFRPPLPPEDRIWRHPSEVAAAATRPTSAGRPAPSPARHTLALVTAAALIGATLSLGVVAALGGFEDRTRVVERQVAIQPVTSTADDGALAISERTSPSVAGVFVSHGRERRTGTAVVLRSDGHLLTTASLVEDADEIDVRIPGRAMLTAEVVGHDGASDLAVLHVDADDLEPAPVGTADGVRAGQDAMVMGHGDGAGETASLERTMISAVDRRLRTADGAVLHGMLLLGSPLPPASAGGPLLDPSGAVIGIATSVPASDDDERSYGVATPIDLAVHAADQIIEHGHVRHVWLGIEGVDLVPDEASAMGVAGGADVQDVVPSSPAASAGITAGDVVVGIDGEDVSSMSQLIAELRGKDPGDQVVLDIRRGDVEMEMTARLVERDGR